MGAAGEGTGWAVRIGLARTDWGRAVGTGLAEEGTVGTAEGLGEDIRSGELLLGDSLVPEGGREEPGEAIEGVPVSGLVVGRPGGRAWQAR